GPTVTPPLVPPPLPTPTPSPTPPPITVSPQAAQAPIGVPQQLVVGSVIGPINAVARDPNLLAISIDQDTRIVTLTGEAPGTTVVTISDARGLTRDVPVSVAYQAGTIAPLLDLRITGDPASADFIRETVARAVLRAAQPRPGAQVLVGPDDVSFDGRLGEDDAADLDTSVVIQGEQYFNVSGTTRVRVENVATPRISPDQLMVSDFPEVLTEDGVLFAADLRPGAPSRFLFYHYDPPSQPDRRVVLRAENDSGEPALVQFIRGTGGPNSNEMQSGHDASKQFLVRMVQNEGRLITIGANSSRNLVEADLPHGSVVCALLQLRVLSGEHVRLTLFAQNATGDPNAPITQTDLLVGAQRHARGIYTVPEFRQSIEWNVDDPYLELPIGLLPLPNSLRGEALSGDYGVLQSFVVNVVNPTAQPQSIAIYENPRGGRATGTYLIDGVLVQSHQVPAFSRYKIRQYVVPARGFVRVTIESMPEGGSSYPLDLIFAPDDGSVAPGAPGSPIY
ncbi:MAG TPA: hypothetical protein VIN40_06750, partial [Candidatus Tyrphobacter sp.]